MATMITAEMILEERRNWRGLSHSLNVDGRGTLYRDCPCITCKNYFDPTGEKEAEKRNNPPPPMPAANPMLQRADAVSQPPPMPPPPPAAMLGRQTGEMKAPKQPSAAAIAAFDSYDYVRLTQMGCSSVKQIGDITDERLADVAALLQALINQGKLYMMDKEDGEGWQASGVIGFKKDGLLIFHKR